MKHTPSTQASYAATLLICISSLAMPAQAQFAKPEDAIKYRKAALTVMGAHFGRVAAMAGGRAPFPEGSDKGETKAKPEIWTDKARFAEAADKLQAELTKLNVAARMGTLDALKPAVASVAGACKNCHDNFRQ